MEVPYQSTRETGDILDQPPPIGNFQRPPGLTRHVRVVAVLMIVQGVLELMMVSGIVGMALVSSARADWAAILVLGGALCVAPFLHIAAGMKNYRFQGKVLGVAALASWPLTSYWCCPTALALAMYGLIVYLNRSASTAFRLRESGHPADDILAVFRKL